MLTTSGSRPLVLIQMRTTMWKVCAKTFRIVCKCFWSARAIASQSENKNTGERERKRGREEEMKARREEERKAGREEERKREREEERT